MKRAEIIEPRVLNYKSDTQTITIKIFNESSISKIFMQYWVYIILVQKLQKSMKTNENKFYLDLNQTRKKSTSEFDYNSEKTNMRMLTEAILTTY